MLKFQYEFKWILLAALLLCVRPAFAQKIAGQISKIGDATHLEFSGRQDWTYDAQNSTGNKLTLRVPAFDDITEARLKSWSDHFIRSVSIDKNGPDNSYLVTFEFVGPEVEYFDYLTDDPSRLIVDFYRKTKVEEVKVPAPAPQAPLKNALPEKKSPSVAKKAKGTRKPASDEWIVTTVNVAPTVAPKFEELTSALPQRGVFDAGDPDFSRFILKDYKVREEALIASAQNIYLKFPMLKMPVSQFQDYAAQKPEYEVIPNSDPKISRENSEAMFLVQMYNEKRFGPFTKAYEFFIKKYPNSRYDEIVRNLNAEFHVDRFRESHLLVDYEVLKADYKYLIETYPSSALLERQRLLVGYASLDAKDALVALQELQSYQKAYPKSEERERVELAIAEAYLLLKKPDDAIAIYKELEREAKNKNISVESAFRVGDVYFSNKNYKMAAKEYERVIEEYPSHARIFQNAHFNLSECYFWQGQNKEALEQYVTYVKKFPSDAHGGYALTRIGEVLERLGADSTQVMGAFLESYFRYPSGPSAAVARIRMLSRQFKGMKEKEKSLALKEMEELGESTELPRMDEFVTLMVAEGMSRRGEFRPSLDRLLTYFRAHPTTANFKIIESRVVRNIADILKSEVEAENFLEALNFYGQYAKTWLKKADRVDAAFFQARAYEQAGVEAQAILLYEGLLEKMSASSWRSEERARKFIEHLPSQGDLHLRLAKVYANQKKYPAALKHLKAIATPLSNPSEVERAQVGAQVAEASNDFSSAKNYLNKLIENWKGQPELLIGPYLKLAEIQLNESDLESVDRSVTYIENMITNQLPVTDDQMARYYTVKSEHKFKSGQPLAAVETYLKFLDGYENKRPLQGVRYRAGLILFDEGDLRGAEKIWSGFDAKTGVFYQKLAQEKLSNSKWTDSYQRYTDRIPAAESLR